MKNTIRLFVADDHQMIIEGIKNTFSKYIQYQVVGETTNPNEVLRKLEKTQPDLLILDLSMPHLEGVDLVPDIRRNFPGLKILVYTMRQEAWVVQKVVNRKVDGFINKTQPAEKLIEAVRKLSSGEMCFPPHITSLLLPSSGQGPKNESMQPDLTRRERQVLDLVLQECNSQDIAQKLNLSKHTVIAHRKSLIAKFDVRNTVGLVKQAYEKGMV